MPKIYKLLANILHPAGIAALVFSLGIPLLIAIAGNSGLAGPSGKELIGKLDLNLAFWIFSLQGILFALLSLDLFKDFRSYIKQLNPGTNWWIVLGAFIVVATAVTGSWIEGRHRVQSDESILLTTAQNLYHRQVSGACDEGEYIQGNLKCNKSANNFKARGLSYLYALGMPIFGKDLQWIFHFHLILFALSGILFFLAVLAWTRQGFLALVATTALIFQPTVMFQFRSSSVEPLYVFLSALSLLLMHWALQRDTVRHWTLLALALAFFAQTRQETVFCLGAFVLLVLPKLLSAKDFRFPAFISALSFFSLPVLLTISYYQGYGFQGGEFEAHGNFLQHVKINWKVMSDTALQANGMLSNPFLTSSTWLALLGGIALCVQAMRKDPLALKTLVFFVLYHIQTYMILENVSGDFTIEINQRYALVMFPTIAFLTAYILDIFFFDLFTRLASIKVDRSKAGVALVFALIASVILAGITMRHKTSFENNIMYNRNHLTSEEFAILSWVRSQPHKNRLFIYSRPWHFIGYGYSSMHYDVVRNMGGGELQELIKRYDQEVYYVRGLDCWDRQTWHKKAVETRIASVCDDLERKIEFDPVHRTLITNNYQLTISKIRSTRDFDIQSLLQVGLFHYLEANKNALVSYKTEFVPNRPWVTEILINEQVAKRNPFNPGGFMDTIAMAPVIPGYNRATVRVVDTLLQRPIVSRDIVMFFPLSQSLTPLTKLNPSGAFQTWGQLVVNKSVIGNPLRVANLEYTEGFGTHANSKVTFDLGAQYKRLTAKVGQDDEELGGDGMQFRILGDNKELWKSPIVKGSQIHSFDISVAGIRQLVLEVDSLGGKDYDHADWIEPVLFK